MRWQAGHDTCRKQSFEVELREKINKSAGCREEVTSGHCRSQPVVDMLLKDCCEGICRNPELFGQERVHDRKMLIVQPTTTLLHLGWALSRFSIPGER